MTAATSGTVKEPVLAMRRITKRFGGAVALEDVSFDLRAGEVHALVGENGAGKSTLVKILTGAYHRDAGEIRLDGHAVSFATPAEAQAAGVCVVHQEIQLLGRRTVAENIFLGREPLRRGLVDWTRMRTEAAIVLSDLGMDIDAGAVVRTLGTARRQMVAIARGISLGARVLVLDEPTSALSEREASLLFTLIRRLQSQDRAVIYISHRFEELYALCDRVTVLRDGVNVTTRELAGLERIELVRLMLGKTRDELAHGTTAFSHHPHRKSDRVTSEPLLQVTSLADGGRLRDVSLEVRAGEIVGLAGLLGSGRSEVARVIFGATQPAAGEIRIDGTRHAPRTPADAIRAGIGYVPEDRKLEGIIPDLSVRENLTLAALPALTRFGVVSRRRQGEIVTRLMARLGIRASSADQPIRELSGGNQQKVLLARWICTSPKLLILDEPTRGVDVGAKSEIQAMIDALASDGLAVLMISSELEEIVEGSERVVVLRDGRSVAALEGDDVHPDAIVHAMAEGSSS